MIFTMAKYLNSVQNNTTAAGIYATPTRYDNEKRKKNSAQRIRTLNFWGLLSAWNILRRQGELINHRSRRQSFLQHLPQILASFLTMIEKWLLMSPHWGVTIDEASLGSNY